MAKLAREEEAKAKEQELEEASIQEARENINQQNNNDTSPIEQWRKSTYHKFELDDDSCPEQYLCD